MSSAKFFWMTAVTGLLATACTSDVARQSRAPSSDSGEVIASDEAEQIANIENSLRTIIAKQQAEDPDHVARRDAHSKHHGCVRADFTILPDEQIKDHRLKVGLFANTGKKFHSWIRFSNGNSNVHADADPDGRGMAIKVVGVPGDKLLPDEMHEQTQDFVMINYPTFFVRKLSDYPIMVEAFRKAIKNYGDNATGDAAGILNWWLKTAKPDDLHFDELKAQFAIVSQVVNNPLTTRYWSQVPYTLGVSDTMKYSAQPVLCPGVQPVTQTLAARDKRDFLRENMLNTLTSEDACFDFMMQVRKGSMSIEDSVTVWPETKPFFQPWAESSPFQKVAFIRIHKISASTPAQEDFTTPEQLKFCEDLSFTPWHALPEHRPLGAINRARRSIYQDMSKFRHSLNQTTSQEPQDWSD